MVSTGPSIGSARGRSDGPAAQWRGFRLAIAAVSSRGEGRPREVGKQEHGGSEPHPGERDNRRQQGNEQDHDLDSARADLPTPEEHDRPQQVEDELAAEQAERESEAGIERRAAVRRPRRTSTAAAPISRYSTVQTGPNTASGGVHDGFESCRYHDWPLAFVA